jgi:hypothetical protein
VFHSPTRFDVRAELQVVQNDHIDVSVMDRPTSTAYQEERSAVAARRRLESVTDVDVVETFEDGGYRLVLDNTHAGSAQPVGEVDVQFTLELTDPDT